MDFAPGGDLFTQILHKRAFLGHGERIRNVFLQLIDAVERCHDRGVYHRDLKPENILLDAAGTLKISDFGLSAVYKLKESGKTRLLNERCGSMPYVAPVVF